MKATLELPLGLDVSNPTSIDCVFRRAGAADEVPTVLMDRSSRSGKRSDSGELFTDDGSDPGSQKLDRP